MSHALLRRMVILHLLFSFTYVNAITIFVTTNDGGSSDGSLNAALQQAQDGDIIDCSEITGQTINLFSALPAIGHGSITNPTLTIVGSNVTIDGGNIHPGFSLGQGSAIISDITIQNGLSQGGNGGSGQTGGGGGTGGGGALYLHSGTTMTINTINVSNNQAIGGSGGTGDLIGGSGGGGGGFGGGTGGTGHVNSGSGGGGGAGGNNGGVAGGTSRGVGIPNTFTNFGGAGGGGGMPGIPHAGAGGSNATSPSTSGGAGGLCSVNNAGGGGGGGGAGGSGHAGSNAIDATSPGSGFGGQGGAGFGVDNSYGCGGGGGGGSGGAGSGTSGGGGGLAGPGGIGGNLGGGGGAASSNADNSNIGGNGGFGAGGGGGYIGGIDSYSLGGAGGSATNAQAGGGGGSGLGGGIFIQKNSLLIMQDGNSISGNTTIAGLGGAATTGTNGANGSSLGQDIFIQSGGAINFQINNNLTLLTPIEGGGLLSEVFGPTITTSGNGIVNLVGANNYLGDTLIQSGTLNLNGSVLGDITIESGGILSGNTTNFGNIYNNGTISPGNGLGTISTTDLYLYPTSTYNVDLNSTGDSDIIIASGSADIDGNLTINPVDLNFTQSKTYTIIDTQTGVTGTFNTIASTTPSLIDIDYNPSRLRTASSSVTLTFLPLAALDLTNNAAHVADAFALLSGSDAAIINQQLLALSFSQIESAFDQMSPALLSAPTEVALLDIILVRSTYSKHLQKFYFHNDQGCEQPMSLWIDGFAQWQNQNDLYGYDDTTAGMTLGFDYSIRNWVVGGAFSVTHDDFSWQYFKGLAHIISYHGGFYARWQHNNVYLNFALIDAFNTYTIDQQISLGSTNRYKNSNHNGNEMLAHVGFEYWASRSYFQWTPYINLDYVFLHEKSYAETGASSLNLSINQKNSALFQGEVGIALSTTCTTSKGTFLPMLTIAYINQTPCSQATYFANFVGASTTFSGTGQYYERNLCVPRFALTYESLCDKVNVSIYYDAQIADSYWAQDIVLNFSVHF